MTGLAPPDAKLGVIRPVMLPVAPMLPVLHATIAMALCSLLA
jgi:hypothetical protein